MYVLTCQAPDRSSGLDWLNLPEHHTEITLKRRKCSGNRNQHQNQTQSKSGNERLIPFPLGKPIQGLFYTSLCVVVCGLPLKSDENPCRFSNEDKAVFCDCGGAEEGERATCGARLERHKLCAHPEIHPTARVCRAICRKLGKSYDFCMSPTQTRRSFCSCFDASRTQKKGNRQEIEDVSEQVQEEIPALVPAPASINPFEKSPAVVSEPEIVDADDDVDVDVNDAEEASCADGAEEDENRNDTGTENRTAIKNLRQQTTGTCHPVLSALKMKMCTGICGTSAKTCRVNKEYRKVYCDCPGNEEGPQAFCGPHAEMYSHCYSTLALNKQDCTSLCSELGKRGEICRNPQNSQSPYTYFEFL